MPRTSDRVSRIAGDLMDITEAEIRAAARSPVALAELTDKIRTVAASATRQRFFRKLIDKVTGG